QRAIAAGRDVVRRHYLETYPDGKETHQRWLAVADWLPTAPDLHDWRELANLLLRMSDPTAEDPVPALAAFLRRDRFEIELRIARLSIPDDFRDLRLRPAGRFVVYVQADGTTSKLNFRPEGEGNRDARTRVTTFTFVAEG